MNYDREILAVLTQAGEKGLKLEHIVRHVYNACNSMFTPLNYKDVYAIYIFSLHFTPEL